jgi:enoyl-CoA hydratase/isomerase-like protein
MSDPILLHIDQRAAFITFNRPDRLNAIDLAMARAFREVVERLESRDDVRAVVLRGAGAAFVAGGDITIFGGDRGVAAAAIGELIDTVPRRAAGFRWRSPRTSGLRRIPPGSRPPISAWGLRPTAAARSSCRGSSARARRWRSFSRVGCTQPPTRFVSVS